MHLLDARAALLWDLHAGGLSVAALAELLSERFRLQASEAHKQVEQLIATWHDAGLLAASPLPAALRLDLADDPILPPPCPRPLPVGASCVLLADRRIQIASDDVGFNKQLDALLSGARPGPSGGFSDHRLQLHGAASAWRLSLDERPVAQGEGTDAALVSTLSTLTELGCRPAERLLVLHRRWPTRSPMPIWTRPSVW